jgi:hypothetical protein
MQDKVRKKSEKTLIGYILHLVLDGIMKFNILILALAAEPML